MSGRRPLRASCILALVLAGCAVERPAPSVDWSARAAQVSALPAWSARGRIAVRAESGGGQGDLRWSQSGEEARIRVSGPFGAGAVARREGPVGIRPMSAALPVGPRRYWPPRTKPPPVAVPT